LSSRSSCHRLRVVGFAHDARNPQSAHEARCTSGSISGEVTGTPVDGEYLDLNKNGKKDPYEDPDLADRTAHRQPHLRR
jgi:hypothetical protein